MAYCLIKVLCKTEVFNEVFAFARDVTFCEFVCGEKKLWFKMIKMRRCDQILFGLLKTVNSTRQHC